MKAARIENNVVVELFEVPQGFSISECIHPQYLDSYTEVPDNITLNSKVNSKGVWTIAPPQEQSPTVVMYPTISRSTFKLLFTSEERVLIKSATGNLRIQDWWETATDPSLPDINLNLMSTQSDLSYLVTEGFISEERRTQILLGREV